MIGVLQTWTRDLRYHPHVHYLIPGGGLSPDGQTCLPPACAGTADRSPGDRQAWLPARRDYLLPEKPLAKIFRAKFRDMLKKANLFDQVPPTVWSQDWVVDIIPVGSGEAALKYLAPYIFRVAISNKNILALEDGNVTFRYRDSQTDTVRTATVTAEEFIRRFLQHVLPRGFQKVRTYGLLNPRQRRLLRIVKEQLQVASSDPEDLSACGHAQAGRTAQARLHTPIPPRATGFRCPRCRCEMIQICQIPRKRGPP